MASIAFLLPAVNACERRAFEGVGARGRQLNMVLMFSGVFNTCGCNSGREQPEMGRERTRTEAELGRSGV